MKNILSLLTLTLITLTFPVNATVKAIEIEKNLKAITNLLIAQTPQIEAEILFNEALQLYQQNTTESLQEAIIKWQEALLLYEQIENRQQQALTNTWIALSYNKLGDHQQALIYHNRASYLYQEIPDSTNEEIIIADNLISPYSDLEKQTALEYLQQNLPNLVGINSLSEKARNFNYIGSLYNELGEKKTALEYYQQALILYKEINDIFRKALTLNKMGNIYNDLGEKETALEYYQQSLPLWQLVGSGSMEYDTLIKMSTIYAILGNKEIASNYYQKATEIPNFLYTGFGLGELGLTYELDYWLENVFISRAFGKAKEEGLNLYAIASCYNALGEKQIALEYYQQALSLLEKSQESSIILYNIGTIYYNLGNRETALSFFEKALSIIKQFEIKNLEVYTLNYIGHIYNIQGQPEKALTYLQEALSLAKAVKDIEGEALSLYYLAFLEKSRGNLQSALTLIEQTVEFIEVLRREIINIELRQMRFNEVQPAYQFYLDLLMELHQKNPHQNYDQEAFNISEKSRARVLLELLTEANANIKEGVDPFLLKKENDLQNQLNATEKERLEIYNNPNSNDEQKANINQRQQQLIQNLKNLQDEIRENSPNYSALKYPQPLTLEEVQSKILDDDTLLLQYALGEEKSYLFSVTKDSFNSYELPANQELNNLINNLRVNLTNTRRGQNNYQQASQELSNIIIAPIINQLSNKKRLLIVADGDLNYLPFSALNDPTQSNFTPLIQTHEIINLPSASTLQIIRNQTKNRPSASKILAMIADPVFSSDDERITNRNIPENNSINTLILERASRAFDIGWDRLLGTRQEALNILNLIPDDQEIKAFDFNANQDFINNPEISNYQYVHIATHGFLNAQNPELSGIVLSLVDQAGNPQNGYLRLGDIFNLKLNAELVVLSACQTGLGSQLKGEGIIGLTRGLMYAGGERLLLSLWNVDDNATAEFMTIFYQLMLEKNLNPAQALKETQLMMQNSTEYNHPYYWSAFVLQGEYN
jgi:CHAT domain-containing protein/tetratricopeptide (TPR) repeat protein